MKTLNNNDYNYLTSNNLKEDTAVLLLHGYGANKEDLAPIAECYPDLKCSWYVPDAPIKLPGMFGMKSLAWFDIDQNLLMQAQQSGQGLDLKRREIDTQTGVPQAMIEQIKWIKKSHKKLVIGGFSQGAMLSLLLYLQKPELIDGVFMLSGNPFNIQTLYSQISQVKKRVPIFQSHGQSDPVLAFKFASELKDELEKCNFDVQWCPFQGQHEIPQPVLQNLGSFLSKAI